MNIYDASKILGLSGDVTPDQFKAAYRAACRTYHPDINSAGEEMMKVINTAYDALKNFSGTIKDEQSNYGELFNNALKAVLPIHGVIVEVCGAWIWITGDTRTHKETLKKSGFKWSKNKKAWYFRPEQFRSFSRGNATLEEIREKYGSKRPQGPGFTRLGGTNHA
ncbi:J domain-containing protein [Roseibium sp. HPY-6]|uniref:J domain-containing protein n=1 Tax=Roseibium sp. HPY-6 TaxID=3229852 RepID=UPI00338D4F8A